MTDGRDDLRHTIFHYIYLVRTLLVLRDYESFPSFSSRGLTLSTIRHSRTDLKEGLKRKRVKIFISITEVLICVCCVGVFLLNKSRILSKKTPENRKNLLLAKGTSPLSLSFPILTSDGRKVVEWPLLKKKRVRTLLTYKNNLRLLRTHHHCVSLSETSPWNKTPDERERVRLQEMSSRRFEIPRILSGPPE